MCALLYFPIIIGKLILFTGIVFYGCTIELHVQTTVPWLLVLSKSAMCLIHTRSVL